MAGGRGGGGGAFSALERMRPPMPGTHLVNRTSALTDRRQTEPPAAVPTNLISWKNDPPYGTCTEGEPGLCQLHPIIGPAACTGLMV